MDMECMDSLTLSWPTESYCLPRPGTTQCASFALLLCPLYLRLPGDSHAFYNILLECIASNPGTSHFTSSLGQLYLLNSDVKEPRMFFRQARAHSRKKASPRKSKMFFWLNFDSFRLRKTSEDTPEDRTKTSAFFHESYGPGVEDVLP